MRIIGAFRLDCDLGSSTAPFIAASRFALAGIQQILKLPADLLSKCGQALAANNRF